MIRVFLLQLRKFTRARLGENPRGPGSGGGSGHKSGPPPACTQEEGLPPPDGPPPEGRGSVAAQPRGRGERRSPLHHHGPSHTTDSLRVSQDNPSPPPAPGVRVCVWCTLLHTQTDRDRHTYDAAGVVPVVGESPLSTLSLSAPGPQPRGGGGEAKTIPSLPPRVGVVVCVCGAPPHTPAQRTALSVCCLAGITARPSPREGGQTQPHRGGYISLGFSHSPLVHWSPQHCHSAATERRTRRHGSRTGPPAWPAQQPIISHSDRPAVWFGTSAPTAWCWLPTDRQTGSLTRGALCITLLIASHNAEEA